MWLHRMLMLYASFAVPAQTILFSTSDIFRTVRIALTISCQYVHESSTPGPPTLQIGHSDQNMMRDGPKASKKRLSTASTIRSDSSDRIGFHSLAVEVLKKKPESFRKVPGKLDISSTQCFQPTHPGSPPRASVDLRFRWGLQRWLITIMGVA